MLTAIVAAVALTLTVSVAPASASTISSAGPLQQITVSPDLNCDVRHVDDTQPEWYGTTACGTLMALNGVLYGPANIPAGSGASPRTSWTRVSQTPTTGSGTLADPYTITTVVSTGTGVTITQTDRYVLGNEFYDTSVTIDNGSLAVQSGLVYTAGDCYLQNSDYGYGKIFGTSPACATSTQPGARLQQLIPRTGGNTFYQASYSSVWNRIGQQQPFPNTCQCNSHIDNGIGIAWPTTVPVGGSATFEWTTAFSPSGHVPVVISAAAHQPTSRPTEPNGYTIRVSNPNVEAAVLADLTVELPPDFTYRPGSATGIGEPSVSGSTLTFPGPIEIPPNAQLEFAIGVTVGTTPGVFTIDVSGTGVGIDVTGTTGAAPITVIAQADLEVTKSAPEPAEIVAGSTDPTVFTVEAINNGPGLAQEVRVIDAVPPGMTFSPGSSSPGCFVSAGSVQCAVGDLPPSATETFQIAFTASPDAAGNRTNTAVITGTVEGDDPANNTASSTVNIRPSVDLSVTKTPESQDVDAGATASFTITVANEGPSRADYTLTDAVSAGLTVVGFTGTGCTATPIPTCSGSLYAGQSSVVQVTARVAPDLDAAAVLQNLASVTAPQPDSDPTNNSDVAEVSVTRSADLAIEKIAPETFAPGASIGYILQVSNLGPSSANGVVVTDTVPPGTTFDPDLSSPACDVDGTEVECSLATLAAGATARFDIAFLVPPGVAEGATITNTATVAATEPDPVPGNNSSSAESISARQVDLYVTKASPGAVPAGGDAIFEMVIGNRGPSDASGVVVDDPVIPEIVWSDAEVTAGPGSCVVASGELVCDIPTLAVGETVAITLTGVVDGAAVPGSAITNTVTVDANEPEVDEADNTASAAVTVQRNAGLDLVKTVSDASVIAGTAITYTYEVFARGPSDALDVVLTDPLPPELTDAVVTPPAGATCAIDPATGILGCELGNLAAGPEPVVVTVTATVDAATPNGFALSNTATATEEGGGQAQSTAITSVQRRSAIVVQKTPDTGVVPAGSSMEWTVTVTNEGPSYLTTGVLVERPDASHTITGMTPDEGATCDLETLTCEVQELAPGGTVTIAVAALVAADHPGGTLSNRSTAVDPQGGSATDTGQVDVIRVAELSLTKAGSPEPVIAGQTVAYTIVVGNPTGPSTATGVLVTDTLPGGLVFDAGASTPGCSAVASVVTCAIGTLGVGEERRVTVGATVPAGTDPGVVRNTATAIAAEDDVGATATADSTIVGSADLSLVKAVTTGFAGAQFDWTLELTNLGPSEADEVHLTDAVDASLEIISVIASDGSDCEVEGQDVTCSIGTVGVEETVTVTITVAAAADAVPVDQDFVIVGNEAAVTAVTGDPNPGNDTANATAIISPQAHLVLTKTAPATALAGTDLAYELTVVNEGPSVATFVEAVDVLDAALVFVPEASHEGCELSDPATNEVRCAVDELAPGQTQVFTVTTRIDPGLAAGSTLVNSASARSARPDPEWQPPVNVVTAIEAEADLEVVKTVDPTSVAAGGQATYTVVVTNHGPSSALDVTLDDASTATALEGGPEAGVKGMIDCAADGLDFGCSIPELRPGESYTLTFSIGTDPLAPDGTVISNTATVASSVPDPDPDNNSSSADLTLFTSGALRIAKTPDVPEVRGGGTVVWTIAVSNDGPSALRSVTVADAVPDALSVTGVPDGCTLTAPRLTCTVELLMPGETVTFVVRTAVAHGATGTVTNSAFATAEGSESVSVSASVRVTAGTLPAAGFPAATALAWAFALALSGCGLLLARRRTIG